MRRENLDVGEHKGLTGRVRVRNERPNSILGQGNGEQACSDQDFGAHCHRCAFIVDDACGEEVRGK